MGRRSVFPLAAVLAGTAVQAGSAPAGAGSVRFNPATHTAVKSAGCGQSSPYKTGKSVAATATFGGQTWTYNVYVPSSYTGNTPLPLIIQFPGWGLSAASEERGAGISGYADSLNFISVTAQGQDDNTNFGGPWYSWNTVGSTLSPGPGGPTCTSAASAPQYCYTSCGSCSDTPQCWWTTCQNCLTPTGTGKTSVDGFVVQLYNTLESQLCIDTTREYASGESNGGMFTYQLGVDLSSRLAAIFPGFGSFHRGFNEIPSQGVPVLDLHGTQDTTVPANVSLSGDGYYYTVTSEIFGGNTYAPGGWKSANGCSGSISHYPTTWDGQYDLYCVSEGTCTGGDVVRCAWNGGHNWYGNKATAHGGLVTEFLFKWAKASHVGGGRSVWDEPAVGDVPVLKDVVVATDFQEPKVAPVPQSLTATPSGGHYGNPTQGCLPDEDVVSVGMGFTCAPKINHNALEGQKDDPAAPMCKLGGTAPFDNGCPVDADVDADSRAWPICLGKGNTTDPYNNGEFHCLLVCPCEKGAPDCGAEADAHCPTGATCQRGELRNMAQGVCVYASPLVQEAASALVV